MKKLFVETYGCQMNVRDSEEVTGRRCVRRNLSPWNPVPLVFGTVSLKVLLICYACVLFSTNAYSKPMFAPTIDEALKSSSYIVVAEYAGYSKHWNKIDYFYGPIATYKVIEILKGSTLPESIQIQYDFTDGSACIVPQNWNFNEKYMPKKRSRWILFLQSKSDKENIWKTYRGDYGRWEADESNIIKIEKQLKK